jgi:hypothetical protein
MKAAEVVLRQYRDRRQRLSNSSRARTTVEVSSVVKAAPLFRAKKWQSSKCDFLSKQMPKVRSSAGIAKTVK